MLSPTPTTPVPAQGHQLGWTPAGDSQWGTPVKSAASGLWELRLLDLF